MPEEDSKITLKPTSEQYDPAILPDLLPLYYKRLFPHKPFYRWLSYGLSERDVFINREISFTLHDDIYIRYLCFDNQSEMEKEICARSPFKIDIGAVMQTRPKNFRTSGSTMTPVQRELVFDIDMTDYDDVRTCCSGAGVCQKCWKFMTAAVRVLDTALREDFGYEHIFWVFSGRRGVHCWVCDYAARHLDSRTRGAVAEYMRVVSFIVVNGTNVPRVHVHGDRLHHSVKRALKFIEPLFEEVILEDQQLFGGAKGIAKLVQLIHEDSARKETEAHLMQSNQDAHARDVWASFVRYANSMRKSNTSNVWNRKLKYIVEEIQLGLMYPRLDINVTKGFNHLLKAPFCVHPATGKVCVPFAASAVAKFDPTTVPTIMKLLHEINAFDKGNETPEERSRIKDHKKTSMFKGVVVFEEFLRRLESTFKSKAIDISDKKLEF